MKIEIEGKPVFAYMKIELQPGEVFIAEADAMATMSADLDMTAKFNGGIFKDICSSVTQSARNHKKMVGYHQVEPNLVELQKRIEEGYDFIAYGPDIVAL